MSLEQTFSLGSPKKFSNPLPKKSQKNGECMQVCSSESSIGLLDSNWTQGGTVCLFYVHESMTFFKFYGRFMDVFHGRITRDASMNSPLSIRKKESNLTTVFDFVKKMWRFPPPQTAILPLERLPGGWTSSSRRMAACG